MLLRNQGGFRLRWSRLSFLGTYLCVYLLVLFVPPTSGFSQTIQVTPSPVLSTTQIFARQPESRDAIEIWDAAAAVLSKPIPFVPGTPLALGFPVTLFALSAVLTSSQEQQAFPSVLVVTTFLFAAFRYSATRLVVYEDTLNEDVYGISDDVDDDIDEPVSLQFRIDATCILLATGVGQLAVVPVATSMEETTTIWPVVLAALSAATLFSVTAGRVASDEELSRQEKLLNGWDQRFRKSRKITDEKDY